MSEETCSSKFASSLRLVVFDAREDAKNYMTGIHNFCNGTEFRSFV